jgi:hypothetical protein
VPIPFEGAPQVVASPAMYYLTVPKVMVVRFDKYINPTYSYLEGYFYIRGVPADMIRLIDDSVVYRVRSQYMWKIPSDSQGYLIRAATSGMLRFTTTDPTLEVKAIGIWLPTL